MSDESKEISDDDLRESIKRIDDNMHYLARTMESFMKTFERFVYLFKIWFWVTMFVLFIDSIFGGF